MLTPECVCFLQLFVRTVGRNLLDVPIDELRSQVSIAVESQVSSMLYFPLSYGGFEPEAFQVQREASSFEIQHEEYRQLQLMCWSRFYEGCKQYAKVS